MDDRKALIDKIAALMAKADSSQFPAEAALFANKAAELMAKHEIEMSDFVAKEEFEIDNNPFNSGKTHFRYEEFILGAILDFNNCSFIINNGQNLYRIVGKRSNIIGAKYHIDIVLNQRKAAWKDYLKKGGNNESRYNWHYSFSCGVSAKIASLKAKVNEAKTGWGLVVVDEGKEAFNWYAAQNKVKEARHVNKVSQTINMHGYTAGSNVSINQGVAGTKTLAIGYK